MEVTSQPLPRHGLHTCTRVIHISLYEVTFLFSPLVCFVYLYVFYYLLFRLFSCPCSSCFIECFKTAINPEIMNENVANFVFLEVNCFNFCTQHKYNFFLPCEVSFLAVYSHYLPKYIYILSVL